MNDDWRLRVDLHKDEFAELLTAHLEGSELEHDLETTFHDRVIVSADGPEVFCYTGSREQAERAEQVIPSPRSGRTRMRRCPPMRRIAPPSTPR